MTRMINPISIGKTSINGKEKNDCSVRALANALECTYLEAYETLNDYGRIKNEGSSLETVHKAYTNSGLEFIGVYGKSSAASYFSKITNITSETGITLGKLLPSLEGSYIIITSSHAVCVHDGEIVDTQSSSRGARVIGIYKRSF